MDAALRQAGSGAAEVGRRQGGGGAAAGRRGGTVEAGGGAPPILCLCAVCVYTAFCEAADHFAECLSVAEPPEDIRLKCANHHRKGN